TSAFKERHGVSEVSSRFKVQKFKVQGSNMIRVLVVDDSAYSRRVITKILESIPEVQVVETATDGQDALKKTIRLRPDLLTLDLKGAFEGGLPFLKVDKGDPPDSGDRLFLMGQ